LQGCAAFLIHAQRGFRIEFVCRDRVTAACRADVNNRVVRVCERDSFDPPSIVQHQSELPFVRQISCFFAFARFGSRCCRIVPGRAGSVRGILLHRSANSRCSHLARIDRLAAANLIHTSLIDRRLVRSRVTLWNPISAAVKNPIKSPDGGHFYRLGMFGGRELRTAGKNRRAMPGRTSKGLPVSRRSNSWCN
jgi:hypothetical protein